MSNVSFVSFCYLYSLLSAIWNSMKVGIFLSFVPWCLHGAPESLMLFEWLDVNWYEQTDILGCVLAHTAITKYHRLRGLHIYFSKFWRLGSPGWVHIQWKEMRYLSGISFIRARIQYMSVLTSWPNRLPKASPTIITLGVRLLTHGFEMGGGHKYSIYSGNHHVLNTQRAICICFLSSSTRNISSS